jgi:hypothetical protein
MRFHNKILLSICGIVLGLQVVTFFVIRFWIQEETETRFATELQGNYSTVSEITRLRANQNVRSCQVTAESPRLKAVIELRDGETLLQIARELSREIRSDLIVITDPYGRPLTRLLQGEASLFELSNFVSIADALELEPGAHMWWVEGHAYSVATVPVIAGSELVGTLTMGFLIRRDDVALISSMTGSEIVLIHDSSVVLSTLEHEKLSLSRLLTTLWNGTEIDNKVFPLHTSGNSYLATFFPLRWESITVSGEPAI